MTDRRTWIVSDSLITVGPDEHLVLWNEFVGDDSPHRSIPSLVRHDRDTFRDEILQVLDDVASFHVDGIRLSKALELEDGLSYLHMTLVWAKRWGDLGVLPNAVKMLAFSRLLRETPPSKVVVRLGDSSVAKSIANTCARLGVPCDHVSTSRHSRWPTLRALRHLMRWFTFAYPSNETSDLIIADYLFRVDPKVLSAGTFRSGYWANLPEMIEQSGRPVTWLHRFTPHPAIPRPAAARKALRDLPRHHLLDQVHGVTAAWHAWKTYRRIGTLDIDARNAFVSRDCDLWPIFEHDWRDSFRGSHPMSIAINLGNLQRLLRSTDPRTLLYIYENQPWEFLLRHLAGTRCDVIAVPHATVRYWDLRYFVGRASNDLLPTRVAVNSPIAKDELMRGGYSHESLHEAEALMYLNADKRQSIPSRRRGILVLGELEVASSQRYLDWAVQLAGERPITFKPHPLVDVSQFSIDPSRVAVSGKSADELIAEAEVVVLGASGTAALETISLGVPTITVLNPRELDLSVVRDHPLIRAIATEAELAVALNEHSTRSADSEDVFYRDQLLTRWKQLLGLN